MTRPARQPLDTVTPGGVVRPVTPATRRAPRLSRRQWEVLALVACGRSNAEIAERLEINEDAVKTAKRSILQRLGARDRAHAVHLAHRDGLFSAAVWEHPRGLGS